MSTSFLQLPRELRDLIYDLYLRCDGGYVYNFETNKLAQANGDEIELALIYTCRQVAKEMIGLALSINTVTFSTYYSEATQELAGRLHSAHYFERNARCILLGSVAPKLVTLEMARVATKRFPMFAPLIDAWSRHEDIPILRRREIKWGEAPSMWGDFVHFMLRLLSKQPEFLTETQLLPRFSKPNGYNVMETITNPVCPWIILSEDETVQLSSDVGLPSIPDGIYADHIKFAYSAASVAIRFLQSCSAMTRSQFKDIVLHEDWDSVAQPECHGRGLLPFLFANSQLRIVRRVNLWQNAFPTDRRRDTHYTVPYSEDRHTAPSVRLRDDVLTARSITGSIGTWIAEALLLPALGMPKSSYTLVFDGTPTLEQSSAAFATIQRDAAWQAALDISYASGSLPQPSWFDRRLRVGYFYESLPAAMRDMSMDSTLIQCNFDPGLICDAAALADAQEGWSLQEWIDGWAAHQPHRFATEPPLPPWYLLKWQRVMPVARYVTEHELG
jgi:hypothetical protein